MLVVGAFFGRAGGIILLGLVASVGLAGATAADQWDGDDVHATPTTAAAVETATGSTPARSSLDLREVADLDSLDGRTIEVEGGVGRIEVILPDGLAAAVTADVDGPGNIEPLRRGARRHRRHQQTASTGRSTDPKHHHRRPAGRRRDRGAPMSTTATTTDRASVRDATPSTSATWSWGSRSSAWSASGP